MSEGPNLYGGYVAFKGWESDEGIERPEDYEALLNLSGVPQPARLLDIGTGRAGLLDWAKARAIETFGTEIIPELADRAAARGHRMIDPTLPKGSGSFDVITALDVLEHLNPDQCMDLLTSVRLALAPGGRFVARFPNGQSPFSGPYQHGDLTHIQYLTPSSLKQIALYSGLEIVGAFNPRSIPPGLRGLKRRAVYLVRDVIETILGFAYFGRRFPMDPNVVVVMQSQLPPKT